MHEAMQIFVYIIIIIQVILFEKKNVLVHVPKA